MEMIKTFCYIGIVFKSKYYFPFLLLSEKNSTYSKKFVDVFNRFCDLNKGKNIIIHFKTYFTIEVKNILERKLKSWKILFKFCIKKKHF